jgi:hypothetical protein
MITSGAVIGETHFGPLFSFISATILYWGRNICWWQYPFQTVKSKESIVIGQPAEYPAEMAEH